jgi:hypothetical protein
MDDELQAAIAWVQQRARELAAECETAEEFLEAFGAPSECVRCGRLGLPVKPASRGSHVCDECLAERRVG